MADLKLDLSRVKRGWIDAAVPVVRTYALTHGSFTMDDVRPLLPEPEHGNWYGCLAARLKNEGVLERDGYQPSTRPETNGRVIARWRAKR